MKLTVIGANSYIARNFISFVKSKEPTEFELYDIQDVHLDKEDNYHKSDLSDMSEVEKISFDSEYIVYFTGMTGGLKSIEKSDEYVRINELYLLNVLKAAKAHACDAKIFFPSTRLVYKGRPGRLKEDAEKEFKTVYAMNKYAAENYLDMYGKLYGLRYCIGRICVPYGSLIKGAKSYGTAEFMMRQIIEKGAITLYGHGEVRRTLTHIEDLCNSIYQMLKCEACINDVYNIGGEDYSLSEMAQSIAEKLKGRIEFMPWPANDKLIESGDTVFDSDKLDALLGKDIRRHNFEEWCRQELK